MYPELKQTSSPAAVRSAVFSLAGRFDAAHALGADRCRMRGVRREHHLVSRAELDVAAGGMEHDPAAHAIQHLFVAVLMPAVGVAGGVAPPVRAQALGTHPGRDLIFARRRAVMPLHRSTSAHRRTSSQARVSVVSRRGSQMTESATGKATLARRSAPDVPSRSPARAGPQNTTGSPTCTHSRNCRYARLGDQDQVAMY